MRGIRSSWKLALLAALACTLTGPARATDGTWVGGTSTEWTDGTNWTSNPNVPDGTATFTSTGNTTVDSNGLVTIGRVQFTAAPNALSYSITLNDFFIVNGAGIFNDSTNPQTFNNTVGMVFQGASTASGGTGVVTYINSGSISFLATSTAGNAHITNGGVLDFFETSNASSATIVNNAVMDFFDSSRAGTANITNSTTGTLTFNNTASAGNATIGNSGTVNFTGASTAANATITNIGGVVSFYNTSTAGNAHISNNGGISGLHFFDTATAGNSTITNAGGALFDFNNSSNAGTANITNNAFMNFNNTSSAANATITNNINGALQFLDGSTAGNATITNNGAVYFGGTSDGSTARVFNNAGGGVDISQVTTGVSVGSIEGAGNIFLGSKVLSLGNTNLSFEISGVIADGGTAGGIGGALTKIGTGTLTLSGVSTYTGNTNVNGGTLAVNGSLVSPVFVNSGGTLSGVGTVGAINALAGGIVAPGNSIGTLNVTNNVSFVAGSIYRVEANAAGLADKIFANGTASLTGGTVQVLAQPGSYLPSTTYTILTALLGRTGVFDSVTTNFIFLTPTLTYDANNVYLTLVRNANAFANQGQTRNQRAVGGALDRSPPGSTLVTAVSLLTPDQARQAYDALSGEIYASTQSALIDSARYMRLAVLGRLRQASYAVEAPGVGAFTYGGPALAFQDPVGAHYGPAAGPGYAFWTQGFGSWGRFDSDGNAGAVRRDFGGFVSGVDARLGPDWRAGVAAGYARSSINDRARSSTAGVDTAQVAAYSGARAGAISVRIGAAFAWHEINTSRSIVFPGFADAATARYGGESGQVFGEIGYGMAFGSTAVEPFAGLAWVHLRTDPFAESGGPAALTGAANNQDVGYSTLGIRMATIWLLQNGWALVPRASIAWQHAFSDITPTTPLVFQSTGAGFLVAGVPLARDAALIEAGFDVRVTPQTSIGISYIGQIAAALQDHGLKGHVTSRF
jgi:outer membrane autotransporter protein